MATFITIGYGDEAGYEKTDAAVRDAAHASDAEQVRRGVVMGMAGRPVQVRNHDGAGVVTEDGPFLTSALPLAGFSIIEADSIEAAVEMAAAAPCAVAQGVVEVWPLKAG